MELATDIGQPIVLVGPNNSGKTTALQAIALWAFGVRQWRSKRSSNDSPATRPGVTVNRRDVTQLPVPIANLLWRDRRTHRAISEDGTSRTLPVRIEIQIDGITDGSAWSAGVEFDYSNDESFVCRPLRRPGFDNARVKDCEFSSVPAEASSINIAYLPAMSGLAAIEPRLEPGRISVLIGEGQTAQVIRNLCYRVFEQSPEQWKKLSESIDRMFGVTLDEPVHVAERGEILMGYREKGHQLDLASSGRGLQQTLLLLAHLYAHPGAVLLLDEPDAHLEILRQRQVFRTLSDTASITNSQIIAASHSEVVLNEASTRGKVIAFVGNPHVMNRSDQLLKALRDIGFEDYYSAELSGWVLYVEDATDLAILRAFARRLGHTACLAALERPFVHYVGTNSPVDARRHFHGLKEAKPDLRGLALFDRLDSAPQDQAGLKECHWEQREIENYLCFPETLSAYVEGSPTDTLFGERDRTERVRAMNEAIRNVESAVRTLRDLDAWGSDVKASDEVLAAVFREFARLTNAPLEMRKRDYCNLVDCVPQHLIDQEIGQKLDEIAAVANPGMITHSN